MKKRFIFLLITGLAVTSCKNVIDVTPLNFIAPAAVTTDPALLGQVLTSAYDRMQDFTYYGNPMPLLGDVMADNIYTDSTIPAGGGRYTQNNRNVSGSHFNIWALAYLAVNDCNTVIANADGLSATDAVKNQLKGEAYGLRAMIFFDLARVYAYEPNKVPTTGLGAGFNKGIVLRILPTTDPASAGPKVRSTIAETYTQIESDFTKAIQFLPANSLTTSVFRMNKGAAYAMLGRLYLYWEKYAQAVTNFDLAFANSNAKLAAAGAYVSQFRGGLNTAATEGMMELAFNVTSEITGVVGANSTVFSYTNPTGRNGFSTFGAQTPSDELIALFEATDDRKAMFYQYGPSSTAATPLYNWCSKYAGAVGAYADNIMILRYSDVLLMKAEALASQSQYAAAAALVVTLRTNRNATTVGVPTDATISNYIQDERRRELFFEGERWFDLKRLGNGITKAAKTAVGSISPTDPRILANIPTGEVSNVPGLPQNPGY
jgi:tetratricopeptide (TPR) repeat protein